MPVPSERPNENEVEVTDQYIKTQTTFMKRDNPLDPELVKLDVVVPGSLE